MKIIKFIFITFLFILLSGAEVIAEDNIFKAVETGNLQKAVKTGVLHQVVSALEKGADIDYRFHSRLAVISPEMVKVETDHPEFKLQPEPPEQ